jgi:polysaccharide pyruvyl transferase WcaK-like protein
MKKIIIRGYYGRDNLGDELMKDIFINSLKSNNVEVLIMNSDPVGLKKQYGISTPEELITGKTPSFKVAFRRLKTIIAADLYIFGGGTILTDKHGFMHLLENSVYFIIRRILRKHNLLISVGATKHRSGFGRFLCRCLIASSTGTYVRDRDSYKLLMRICNKSSRLHLTSDMVLLSKEYIPHNQKKESNVVGVCVMPYYFATYHTTGKDNDILDEIVNQILQINCEHPNVSFEIIPIQYGNNDETDYRYSCLLYDKLKGKANVNLCNEIDLKKKIEIISGCSVVISMRLHALMISALSGNKVIAINHNEKIDYFMKRYSDGAFSVKLDEINKISDLYKKILETPLTVRDDALKRDSRLANENIKIIQDLIREV